MQGFSGATALARGRDVIAAEAEGLSLLAEALDSNFVLACEAVLSLRRQLVVTGMGKSGHIARKVAATFAATGTSAVYIHPGEAAHGDMGMLAPGDVLLVLSNSGNTAELRAIMLYARRTGIPIIGVAARADSLVIELADISIIYPKLREACSVNIAPTTSTTVQLALGDALAMTVMDLRGISREDLAVLHPGGTIGVSLAPVSDIMHARERMPLVDLHAPMPHAISVMTSGCFGLVGVIDANGCLAGLITDGDLRRHFGLLTTACAADVMTPSPKVIEATMRAGDALFFFNENRITAAFVVADAAAVRPQPLGIVHMHDLVRLGLG